MQFKKRPLPLLYVLSVFLIFGLAACEDEGPTSPMESSPPDPGPPEASPSTGGLRVAQLTQDARTVDVAVDGDVVVRNLAYGGVGRYLELDEGAHRVQVFSAGAADVALVETTLSVSGGESVTVAVVGNDPVDLVVVNDERGTSAGDARLRLFNAVPDFPALFDLAVINGPLVIRDVASEEASSYVALVPGNYALELRRGGTAEQIATSVEMLPSSTNTTIFAIGSLSRGDIELIAARDAG